MQLFGSNEPFLVPVTGASRPFSLDGSIVQVPIGHYSKEQQYVFVNDRPCNARQLEDCIGELFQQASKSNCLSSISDENKYPCFILKITAPIMLYELTHKYGKNFVDFQDGGKLLSLVKRVLAKAWNFPLARESTSFCVPILPNTSKISCKNSKKSENKRTHIESLSASSSRLDNDSQTCTNESKKELMSDKSHDPYLLPTIESLNRALVYAQGSQSQTGSRSCTSPGRKRKHKKVAKVSSGCSNLQQRHSTNSSRFCTKPRNKTTEYNSGSWCTSTGIEVWPKSKSIRKNISYFSTQREAEYHGDISREKTRTSRCTYNTCNSRESTAKGYSLIGKSKGLKQTCSIEISSSQNHSSELTPVQEVQDHLCAPKPCTKRRRAKSAPPFVKESMKGFHSNPWSSLTSAQLMDVHPLRCMSSNLPTQLRNTCRGVQSILSKEHQSVDPKSTDTNCGEIEQTFGLDHNKQNNIIRFEGSNTKTKTVAQEVSFQAEADKDQVQEILSRRQDVGSQNIDSPLRYKGKRKRRVTWAEGFHNPTIERQNKILNSHLHETSVSCIGPPIRSVQSVVSIADLKPSQELVPSSITRKVFEQSKIISQIENKYVLLSSGDVVTAMDQHAADERCRLESLQDELESVRNQREILQSQLLENPQSVSLTLLEQKVTAKLKMISE